MFLLWVICWNACMLVDRRTVSRGRASGSVRAGQGVADRAGVTVARVAGLVAHRGAGVAERVGQPGHRHAEPVLELRLAHPEFLAEGGAGQLIQLGMLPAVRADLDASPGRLADLTPAQHPGRPVPGGERARRPVPSRS